MEKEIYTLLLLVSHTLYPSCDLCTPLRHLNANDSPLQSLIKVTGQADGYIHHTLPLCVHSAPNLLKSQLLLSHKTNTFLEAATKATLAGAGLGSGHRE